MRTYLFAHTTNRIDVELGASLFRHLLALPISYFQARRVGLSVARVRELQLSLQFGTDAGNRSILHVFVPRRGIHLCAVARRNRASAFHFYIGISVGATPLFRERLSEKFVRGTADKAFLIEVVTGVETLEAMAVVPQMQRRWEEQLAG